MTRAEALSLVARNKKMNSFQPHIRELYRRRPRKPEPSLKVVVFAGFLFGVSLGYATLMVLAAVSSS